MNYKAAAAIGCVIFLSCSFGCEEAAVTDDEPAGIVMGMAGVTGSVGGMSGGVGGSTGGIGGMTAGAAGTSGGSAGASGGVGGSTGGIGGAAGAMTGGVGGAVTGGMGGVGGEGGAMTGGMGGMGGEGGAMSGGMGGAAGDDGPPGPCPAGWECSDTSVLGATDKDGKPVTGTSCGKGALIECDDADPAMSCPELSKPFCAHVFGVTSCTQLCTL